MAGRTGSFARVGVALAAVAIVVAVNQITVRGRSASVLGSKIQRCNVDGPAGTVAIASGTIVIRGEILTVPVRAGTPGAVLAPPIKVSPGSVGPSIAPAVLSVGVRGAAPRRLAVNVAIRNLTDCPVAVSVARVSAKLGSSPVTIAAVRFGGRDRVIVDGRRRVNGRAEIPVGADGTWRIESTAYADVGALE